MLKRPIGLLISALLAVQPGTSAAGVVAFRAPGKTAPVSPVKMPLSITGAGSTVGSGLLASPDIRSGLILPAGVSLSRPVMPGAVAGAPAARPASAPSATRKIAPATAPVGKRSSAGSVAASPVRMGRDAALGVRAPVGEPGSRNTATREFSVGPPAFRKAVQDNIAAPHKSLRSASAGVEESRAKAGQAFDGSSVQGRTIVSAEEYPGIAGFMEAEQGLSEGNSVWTRPRDLLKRLIPRFGSYGSLPDKFKPSSRQSHKLLTLLIPESDIPLMTFSEEMSDNAKKVVFVERGGRRFVRFFILPTKENLKYYESEIGRYAQDDRVWMGSPQSSARTLTTVTDAKGEFDPIVIKTSLDVDMGGGNRLIEPRDIVHAPIVNDLLVEARKTSDGKWEYFPETAGIGGPGGKGGYLVREFPKEMLDGDAFALPLFALTNPKRGTTWLEDLARASGKDTQSFLLEDVVMPLTDVYSEVAFGHGLVPEMHQQNVTLMVDRKTLKVKSVLLRDLNGFDVDVTLRRARGLSNERYAGESLYDLRATRAPAGHLHSYKTFLRLESLKFLFGSYRQPGVRPRELVKRADGRVLENAARILGADRFGKLRDLKDLVRIAGETADVRISPDSLARRHELKQVFERRLAEARAVLLGPKRLLKRARYALEGGRLLAVGPGGSLIGVADAGAAGREIARADLKDIKVSVILPVYNNVADVDRALESILGQTHKNLEVFLVDDHSTDGVFEHVRSRYKDPRLHVIRLSKNAGLFALDNYVLKNHVTGDYVTWQDSDDYSDPSRIETQLRHALRYDLDAAGTYWRSTRPDGSHRDIGTAFPHARPGTGTRALLESPFAKGGKRLLLSGGTKALYKTDSLLMLGGFDGTKRFSQDSVFNSRFMRIFRTGAVAELQPLYYWVRRAGSLTTSARTGLFSLKRLRRRLLDALPASARLNELYRRDEFRAFAHALVRNFYYPPSLAVAEYSGRGLPEGRAKDFNAYSEKNQSALAAKVRESRRERGEWKGTVEAAKRYRRRVFFGPITLGLVAALWTAAMTLKYLFTDIRAALRGPRSDP